MAIEFKLPELGENVKSGTVTRILTAVGKVVALNQPILEIETDKAVLEVPSTVSGKVIHISAKEGNVLKVGDLVLTVDPDSVGETHDVAPLEFEVQITSAPILAPEPAQEFAEPPSSTPSATRSAPVYQAPIVEEIHSQPEPATKQTAPSVERTFGRPLVPASPSVRGFAREVGVDIAEVAGTGPGGRITIQDVKDHARRINTDVRVTGAAPMAIQDTPLPDFSRWGETERQAMTNVRRRIAQNMTNAWSTIPHVTQFDKVDVTELEKLRKQFGKKVEDAGGKLTITSIIVKVLASALKKFPQFNASIDMANAEVVYKKYYNIGMAVDTDRGLLVPVVRDADKKNLTELSVDITELAEKAKNRKTTLEEMSGATFTVSNLGGIGGTAFTPIVNPPEVAILGIARTHVEPVYVNTQFEPRLMLPLALSYDHRIIDGADGARFLRWIVQVLEQPFLLFLEG